MIGVAKEILVLLVVYASIQTYAYQVNWDKCNEQVQGCMCKWTDGKKTANCTGGSFTDIPNNLNDEIQILNLDHSVINVIRNEAFSRAGLVNLQKLSMRHCQIREIEENAFAKLAILIEIDLTGNQIRRLKPSLFAPVEKLRIVYLNKNSIEELEDGLFANLKFLQTVELEDNQISHIGNKTFDNMPKLKKVNLNGNRLSSMTKGIFEKFDDSLRSLQLKNNPWRCDCRLRDLVMWYTPRLYADPITCFEPAFLANTTWKQIKPEEFAC